MQNGIAYKTPKWQVRHLCSHAKANAQVWSLFCPAAIDLFCREVISEQIWMFSLRGSRNPKIDFCLMYIYQMFKTWQTGRRLMAPVLLIAQLHQVLTFESQRVDISFTATLPPGGKTRGCCKCTYEHRHLYVVCPASLRWCRVKTHGQWI